MPDAPAALAAYQLIYTNVEADLSPSRQRGFQVWLASPELTPEQRRVTAKRLDDFRLPPGVAGPAAVLARHVFFHLPEGNFFVVARTVPSAERDKFGRGGKFHAHALLVKADDFLALGCDPFRIIDGGFAFHSAPAEAMALENWRSGALPPAALAPAEPAAERIPLPLERIAELLEQLDRADDKPLVIADRPERVLAALRTCFAELPPSLRRKLEFDTLSTGASLAQIRYAVVGAYSADVLKMWSFRRYHRLDLAAGTCTPPLPAPQSKIHGELLSAPAWVALADGDRECALRTARALSVGRLQEIRPDELTEPAANLLTNCASFQSAVATAIRARIAADLDARLAALPVVERALQEYFAGPPLECLQRLCEPLPWKPVAGALYDAFKEQLVPPDAETLDALHAWLARGHRPPRLELMARRWRGSDADLALIQRELASGEESERAVWLRKWLGETLANATWDSLRAPLSPDGAPEPEEIREARLWLMLHGESTPVRDELNLLTALHRGPEVLAAALSETGRSPHSEGWLVKTVCTRLRDRFRPGWMNDGMDGLYLGLFLVPTRPTDETLLDAAVELSPIIARRVLNALWPVAVRPLPSQIVDTVEPAAPALAAEYNALLAANVSELAEKKSNLRSVLLLADDEPFRWAGNQLLQKLYGEPVLRTVSDDVWFVGLKMAWMQFNKPSHQLATFEAVVGSVVGEVAETDMPDVGRALELRPTRRFSWLLARLSDPNGTERLPI